MYQYNPTSFYPDAFSNDRQRDLIDASVRGPWLYWEEACKELMGWAVPAREPDDAPMLGTGLPQGLKLDPAPQIVGDFARVWSFTRQDAISRPTFVIVAPNSGTGIRQMHDAVCAFGAAGHVRLIAQRDPHYVNARQRNGLDHSTGALVDILGRNPDSHIISFSQSGVPATVATAWMYQDRTLRAAAPASLTVIGSPINTELAPDTLNWLSKLPFIEPQFIAVGPAYAGAGRSILPGSVPKLFFEKAPAALRGSMVPQALPAEHIEDTMRRVFRDHWLSRGVYRFGDDRIDTHAIACPVVTVAGAADRICPPDQTHDLHRLTPHAPAHGRVTLPGIGHYALVSREILERHVVPEVTRAVAPRRAMPVLAA